jgi:hypothetical protein
LIQLILSSINSGLYYTGQRIDILSDPSYVYPNIILSNVVLVTIPAWILFGGWGWTLTDPSYAAQASVEDMDRKY